MESNQILENKPRSAVFTPDNISYGLIFGALLLMPLVAFFLSDYIYFYFFFVILVSFSAWLVGRLKDGELILSSNYIGLTWGLIVVVSLLSAMLSGYIDRSLIGYTFEPGTVISFVVFGLLIFLSASVFISKDRLLKFYFSLMAIFGLGALYLPIRMVLSKIFPVFVSSWPENLIGRWYELGVFFGLAVLISVILLELLDLSKANRLKALLSTVLILSLAIVIFVNIKSLLLILAVFCLLIFVYNLMFGRSSKTNSTGVLSGRKIWRPSLLVFLALLILFGFHGDFLKNKIDNLHNSFFQTYADFRPSYRASFMVATESLKADPILGTGPNRFSRIWSLHKPVGANNDQYWPSDFDFSFAILPTFAITTGALGILSWLLFLTAFAYLVYRAIVNSLGKDNLSKLLILVPIVGSSFLWFMTLVSHINSVALVYAFLLTGLSVAALKVTGENSRKINLIDTPQKNAASAIILTVLLVSALGLGYIGVRKAWALKLFREGASALIENDLAGAEKNLISAAEIDNRNDYYLRSLVDLKLIGLEKLLTSDTYSDEELGMKFNQEVNQAVEFGAQALRLDDSEYLNHIFMGRIYEFLALLGLETESALAFADESYQAALERNPKNPAVFINLTQLEIIKKRIPKAKEYLEESLKIKPNFIPSLLALAQLERSDGNIDEALELVNWATSVAPNDIETLFQAGLTYYLADDYARAVNFLERVVNLSDTGVNANAQYFLGLSYDKLGERNKALEQFQVISRFNPDNQEVKDIMTNLRSGRSALYGIESPIEPNLDIESDLVDDDLELDLEQTIDE